MGTHSGIVTSILREVKMQQEIFPFLPLKQSKDPLRQLCKDQARLGWDKFLHGFVSRSWADEQARHWAELDENKFVKQWYAKVVRLVWEVAWDMWLCHNKAVHNTLSLECSKFEGAVVNTRLAFWYKRGNVGMEQRTRGLWNKSLVVLLQRSQRYKLLWLDTVETAHAYTYGT